MTIKHTGGNWNCTEKNIYFIAGNGDATGSNYNILTAVNEITPDRMTVIETWLGMGCKVFIDSGVFNLANSHAKKHSIRMDAALGLAPDQIDGFDALFERYCNIMAKFGSQVWGYIEVDQGGRENKIKTRARLEALGLRPIPVYHPFNDGWDYFDELASQYDRICFGNIVQADRPTRLRLLATAYERRRKYPHLWIHLLGMTPNEWLNAYPIDSCDSSTWLKLVRWAGSFRSTVALKPFSPLDRNFTYSLEADRYAPNGHRQACRLGAQDAHFMSCTWQGIVAERKEYGFL